VTSALITQEAARWRQPAIGPYAWQDRFGQIFPGATAAAMTDGRHFPFSDDPDGYRDAICAWWADKRS
jgi:hypothetical protein